MKELKKVSLNELLTINFPARNMILAPWLREGETCVIWAAAGVGKTMFSLSLALAAAGGGTLAGWRAYRARKVLYIDGEMHIQDISERMESLVKQGILESRASLEAAKENLVWFNRQAQEIDADFVDLTNKSDQDEIIDEVVNGQYDLLVLDNLTTLSDGLRDENDAVAFKSIQSFLLRLKRTGVATILVHHSNKSGNQMRGSTALEATFEVKIGLHRPKVATPGKACFNLQFEKFRARGDASIEPRKWVLEEDGWHVSDQSPDRLEDDPIYVAIKSMSYVSQKEIAETLGRDKSTVSRRIRALEAMGVMKPGEATECFSKAREVRSALEENKPAAARTSFAEDCEEAIEAF